MTSILHEAELDKLQDHLVHHTECLGKTERLNSCIFSQRQNIDSDVDARSSPGRLLQTASVTVVKVR